MRIDIQVRVKMILTLVHVQLFLWRVQFDTSRLFYSPPRACLSRCRGAGPSATQNS